MPRWSLPPLPDLPAEVTALLRQVPAGRVTTFGDLATALGDVRAARWIAEAVIDGDLTIDAAPVHRIVRKTGELTGAITNQAELLFAENCPFLAERVDVKAARVPLDAAEAPLKMLSEWQLRMAAADDPANEIPVPQTMGGVDLSYLGGREAVAAYVQVDVPSGEMMFCHTIRRRVPFPYIPGYLTFREAPVLLDLLQEVRQRRALDPVILVDGTGRLHPRRAGIAVALGLLAGCVTVGVAKHQLCGRIVPEQQIDGAIAIAEGNEMVGAVLEGGSKRRTLFVSAGYGINLESAINCTRAVWGKQRLPLPIYHADRISRKEAQGDP